MARNGRKNQTGIFNLPFLPNVRRRIVFEAILYE
jgi:hypothetical protein